MLLNKESIHAIRTNTLGKSIEPPYPPALALMESLLFFYKDAFDIK